MFLNTFKLNVLKYLFGCRLWYAKISHKIIAFLCSYRRGCQTSTGRSREGGWQSEQDSESLVDIILHYTGTAPLWTGLRLTNLGKTRDSNAIVENWFRTTKTVIFTSKLHRRAGDFLQLQHEFVVGSLKGMTFVTKQVPPMQENSKDT